MRHLDRIPWDDDVDLCVDATHEMHLVTLAVHLEAERLGVAAPKGLSLRGQRALALLRARQHRIQVVSSRSLVFRITSKEMAVVDIWLCAWALERYYIAIRI